MVEQGDLIRIEGIKHTALVVSKNTFNESGRAVVCPVLKEDKKATLSYSVGDNQFVLCDNPRQLDIESRRYSVIGRISLAHMIKIIDRLQSIFDYY